MTPQIQVRLDEFNAAMTRWARMPRHTMPMALVKQGTKLSFAIGRRLRVYTKKRNAIRDYMIRFMESGGGIKVRASARQFADKKTVATATNIRTRKGMRFMQASQSKKASMKGMPEHRALNWWQVAVKRELAIRESARGFRAFGAMIQGIAKLGLTASNSVKHVGRAKQLLATANLFVGGDNSRLRLEWGGEQSAFGESMQTPEGLRAVADGLADATKDMAVYFERKIQESLRYGSLKAHS